MPTREEYAAKLRDPRWQQVRLRVFERDDWTCQICGAKSRTLHAHHIAYPPNSSEPWEISPTLLFTTCELCHELEHGFHREMLFAFLDILATIGIRSSIDLFRIIERANPPAAYRLAESEGMLIDDVLAIAIGAAIQEWPEEKKKLLSQGIYYANRGQDVAS